MIGIAVLSVLLGAALVFIAAPGMMGFPATVEFAGLRIDVNAVTMLIGVVGPIVGLTWMWRIHWAHLEPDVHPWRYRDFD